MDEVLFSSKSDEWGTPDELFNVLDQEVARIDGCGYGFCLDAAATEKNKKVGPYIGPDHPEEQYRDALTAEWGSLGQFGESYVWLNPPYSKIGAFMAKAQHEMDFRGVITYALVPARTDTRWWWNYCLSAGEIRFLKGRLKFTDNGKALSSAPFPSAVVIFRPASNVFEPFVRFWDWRTVDSFGKKAA